MVGATYFRELYLSDKKEKTLTSGWKYVDDIASGIEFFILSSFVWGPDRTGAEV
jgi:hypothetical protein